MYVAVRYFGCPVGVQCALLWKPPKVVVVPATPADCPPDELLVEIERMAFAAVAAERLHVCADYVPHSISAHDVQQEQKGGFLYSERNTARNKACAPWCVLLGA